MARSHGRIKVGIWGDDDFCSLTRSAQRAYFMLLSQQLITNCGVLSYTPRRWARLAADATIDNTAEALTELQAARFVLIDQETDEILIRTYIEHDGILTSPNLTKAAIREYETITSVRIKRALAEQFPELFQERFLELFSEPFLEPIWEQFPEPLLSARAVAPPRPSPPPVVKERTSVRKGSAPATDRTTDNLTTLTATATPPSIEDGLRSNSTDGRTDGAQAHTEEQERERLRPAVSVSDDDPTVQAWLTAKGRT